MSRPTLQRLSVAALICWFAWSVFLTGIDQRGIYLDERYSWDLATSGPLALVRQTVEDVHPPAYYLFLYSLITFIGSDHLFVIRLSAAIPAVLTVALVFRLAMRGFRNLYVAAAAAVFLASSGLFINYARDLRMYALIAFLSALSWWYFLELVEKKRGRLGYIATVALMAFTYYYAAFVVLAQGAYLLFFYRHAWRRWVGSLLWALAAFLIWIPAFVHQLGVARAQAANPNAPLLGKFLGTVPTTPENIVRLFDAYSAGQLTWLLALVLLSVVGFTLLTRKGQRAYFGFLFWFLFALVVFLGLNLVMPIYGIRYTMPLFPAFALLIGAGVLTLPRAWPRVALIALIAIIGVGTQSNAYQLDRAPHHDLLRAIEEHFQPGDRIWYLPPDGAAGSNVWDEAIYHLKTEFPELSTDWFVWDAPADFADPAQTPRVWDIRAYWMPMLESAVEPLTRSRTLTQEETFGAYTVRLYEAPPPNEQPAVFPQGLNLLLGEIVQHDDQIAPRLWWQAEKPLGCDYSVSVLLRDAAGAIVASWDSTMAVGGQPVGMGLQSNAEHPATTSAAWAPGDAYAVMAPVLPLPGGLAPGVYSLWLGVYDWQDPVRFMPDDPGSYLLDEPLRLLKIGDVPLG